jgi:hypothetical protein
VDGDGVDDLVVFHDYVELLRNDGEGHFQVDPRGFPAINGNRFTCGIFVNRDLLVFGKAGSPGRIFLNDGTGHFREGALLPPVEASAAIGGCAAVADLNGDGYPDVMVAWSQPDMIQVLMNNGDGTFRDETASRMSTIGSSQGGIRRIALMRANQSKDWVLIVTRVGEQPVIKVERNGKFVDSAWQPQASPWVVAPGDFNGDGLLDLVFGQGGGAPLEARFGQAPLL